MKNYLILVLIGFLFLSCDFISNTDNGIVKVYNDTDFPIRVYYEYETESDSSGISDDDSEVITEYDVTTIGARESKTLEIASSITFSGYLKVIYGGIYKKFTVSFNILDEGIKHINENDFHELVE